MSQVALVVSITKVFMGQIISKPLNLNGKFPHLSTKNICNVSSQHLTTYFHVGLQSFFQISLFLAVLWIYLGVSDVEFINFPDCNVNLNCNKLVRFCIYLPQTLTKMISWSFLPWNKNALWMKMLTQKCHSCNNCVLHFIDLQRSNKT